MNKNRPKQTAQILTVLMLFIGFFANAQERAEPFRKANTIIVYTSKTDSANFHDFQRQLLKYDYFIQQTNPDLMTIETKYHALKKHPGWSHSYSYRIIFQDGEIIIKPFWKAGVTSFMGVNMSDGAIRWNWAKSRGNVQNMIWHDALELLKDYPNTKIMYEKK